MKARAFISDFSVACALGMDKTSVAQELFAPSPKVISGTAELGDGRSVRVGRLPSLDGAAHETRTNRIAANCYAPLAASVEAGKARFGADRIGVMVGTSTSGIGEGTEGMRETLADGSWPASFSLARQQLGDPALFLAKLSGAGGPYYAVSTACTSGARAMTAGARMIAAGLCDAVICGGIDSLCDLTLNGFAALDALSSGVCNPMSINRNGLNIGEGGALFLLTRDEGPFSLQGWGETVDGYHMSAPDPGGRGAEAAIRKALATAATDASAIDFVHLHGTATKLNDQMESNVVERVFGLGTPCASTKPLTGHTLGAAGAVQAALCLLAMQHERLPPHVWDGARDPNLPRIRLAGAAEQVKPRRILSASYAFGGNNAALVLART